MSIIFFLPKPHILTEPKRLDLIAYISINSPAVVRNVSVHETLSLVLTINEHHKIPLFLPKSKSTSY